MNMIYVTRSSMPPYEEYIEAIKPLWDSRWLTNMGAYHAELEMRLAEFLDVPRISLTTNGHMALELAIQAFGFPEGSEIITTPFTFISTTHAIIRNHLKPVFCDVRPMDGTMDEKRIEDLITERTVAILPVHVYGNICQTEAIQEIALKYGLKVIYDAAHAFGVRYKGRGIGGFGDASVFSFHATKVFHTIEGGAVAVHDSKFYEKLYNLKNFGIRGEELVAEVGANAKMNEFCAIMGLCNLKHFSAAIQDRKRVYEAYGKYLDGIKGIRLLKQRGEANRNYAYFPILLEKEYGEERESLYQRLLKEGIHARKYFYPITADAACFKNQYCHTELEIARDMSRRVLTLPIYEGLTEKQVRKIVGLIARKGS